ncbi:MAG: InlB B-repeat-containing protein [Clostridia bacterium]|nr:InlB B-repeat-containing protein [Clostridia bacterium]
MSNKVTRIFSLLLAVLMLITTIPVTSIAAEDTAGEETPTSIVFDGDDLTFESKNAPADISYDSTTGVHTLTTTSSVTDHDTVHYYINVPKTVKVKQYPFFVLGIANSTYSGRTDISIGCINGFKVSTQETVAAFRLYTQGSQGYITDTISNVLMSSAMYAGGDKGGYSAVVSDDSVYEYIRLRYNTGGATIPAGTNVDVRFVAFFSTKIEAQNFVYPVETKTVTYMAENEVFATQTYKIGNRIKYPTDVPTGTKKFARWDVKEGTAVAGDTVVNAQWISEPVYVYDPFEITTANQYGYATTLVNNQNDFPAYLRSTVGTATETGNPYVLLQLNTSVLPKDTTVEAAPVVKIGYRMNDSTKKSIDFNPCFSNNVRLWTNNTDWPAVTADNNWQEMIVDMSEMSYVGGSGLTGEVNTSDLRWDYVKGSTLLKIQLRPFASINADHYMDIRYVAIFNNVESAKAWSYDPQIYTLTYKNGDKVIATQNAQINSPLKWIDDKPEKEGMYFYKWDVPQDIKVTKDITLNAKFSDAVMENQYVFKANDLTPDKGGYVVAAKLIDRTETNPAYLHYTTDSSAGASSLDATRAYVKFDSADFPDPFSLHDYPILKVQYRTNLTGTAEVNYNPVYGRLWGVPKNNFKSTGEWSTFNFNLSSITGGSPGENVKWPYPSVASSQYFKFFADGKLNGFFIRPNGGTKADSYLDIAYVGFFKTVADANAYEFKTETYTVNFMDGEEVLYSYTAEEDDELVYPEAPKKPGYGFVGWDVEEGTVITSDLNVNATFVAPKALFDISNYSGSAAGTYIPIKPMTDTETGYDFYRAYESVSTPIPSVDGSRVSLSTPTDQQYDVTTDKYLAFGYRTNISQNLNKVGLNVVINGVRLWGATHASVADGQWHNAVINFQTAFTGGDYKSGTAADYRHGQMTQMQFRPHGANAGNNVYSGDYYDTLYMAVFDDETAAKNYVYPGNDITAEEFTVKFYEADGETLISEHKVKKGHVIPTPTVTYDDGRVHLGWAKLGSSALAYADDTHALINANEEFYALTFKDLTASDSYKKYITDRADLVNVYNKVKAKSKLTVGYIGGSVTVGTGATSGHSWRERITTFLKGYTSVTEVNAAIGGSGSRAGAYRVDTDLIASNPDLVFVEFVVNDGYCKETDESVAKYYETVLRKIRMALPATEIIAIFTTNDAMAKNGPDSLQNFAVIHDAVAAHYGVSSIDVGRALVEAMDGYDSTVWKSYFTDSVHPSDRGYRIYADIIAKYIKDEFAAIEAAGGAATTTYTAPETYYSKDAEIFVTEVIKVNDTEKVTYNEGFKYYEEVKSGNNMVPAYVLTNTKILGYIKPESAGAEVEVTFKGTELNVFMEFASSNAQITYTVDGGEPVAKTLSDTNHPLKLVSGLPNTEHTVKITFTKEYPNVKIGAFFVGSVSVDDLTVTYMDGEEVAATQTYAYGEALVHPDYVIAPSETPGNIRKWSVPEGTIVTEDITVTLTDAPVAPLGIASGRDMRFSFASSGVPGIFMNGKGFTYGAVSYNANGDSYSANLYDPEFAFVPATGNWKFTEGVRGRYGADGSQYITAYVNIPAVSNYLAVGYALEAPNGVFDVDSHTYSKSKETHYGIVLVTDAGNYNVSYKYEVSETVRKVVIDISDLPDTVKNIRAIRFEPWKPEKSIMTGSYFELSYVAGFETEAEANAYVPAEYVAPEQYEVIINAVEGGTVYNNYSEAVTETVTETHYAGENIYLWVNTETGYKFIGWSDGNEMITPDKTTFMWGDSSAPPYGETFTVTNGAVFEIDGALTITPVFEEILVNVTFMDGDEVVETKTVRLGTALEYPKYDLPVSDKEGNIYLWDVEEGTPVTEDIVVNLINKDITPTGVRAGRDMKFAFFGEHFPGIFYHIYGVNSAKEKYEVNGDSYESTVFDVNQAYNAETGIWHFAEGVGNRYKTNPTNYIIPILNLPASTNYLKLAASVKGVKAPAYVGNLVVATDAGDLNVPVDFTNTEDGIAYFTLDVRNIPENAKNIRSIKIWPWNSTDQAYEISNGSYFEIAYIAGFETAAEANAYEYSYTAPEKYAVSLSATEGGKFSVAYGSAKSEYVAEYYENDVIYLTSAAEAGYTFAGWYNGEEKVTGDYKTAWRVREDVKNSMINQTGDAFKVTEALALTAKFEPIYHNLKVEAIGQNQAEEKATFTVNGGEPVSTFDGNAHDSHNTELVAIAPAGLKFEGWYNITDGKNILLARSEELSLYITGDMVIEARFMDETISMPVKLSVTIGEDDEGGTIKIQGDEEAKEDFFDYVSSGRPTTITAVPATGNKVGYWVRVTGTNGTKVLMTVSDKIDAYPLGNEVHYMPVFFAEGDEVRLYVDYANKVIATIVNNSEAEAPQIPDRIGYDADKWVDSAPVNGITVYRATYKKPETGSYALTIMYADGTVVTYGEGGTYPALKYNDQVTLATENANVAWTITKIGDSDANIVMSYKEEYTFNYSFTNNMVIEEKDASGDDVALDTVEAIYDPEAGLIKFVGVFELPEGATHVDHGILLTANAEIGGSEEAFKLNTGADIIVGRIRNNTNPTPAFVINKNNVESGATWYGRAYLVYTIGDETYEIYGDTISCKAE